MAVMNGTATTPAEKEIAELKDAIGKAQQLKYKYEARLASLTEQQNKLTEQMRAEGTTPETIGADIQKLDDSIQTQLAEARGLLPMDLIQREG